MTAISEGMAPRAPSQSFAPFRKSDRNFYLLLLALIWLGIVMGFVPEIVQRFHTNTPPYTAFTPYHAAAFIGWLVLLTAQVLLARTGAIGVHKTLGLIAFALVPFMLVVGTLTAFASEHRDLATPNGDPAFLSLLLCDMVTFAVVATGGLLSRGTPVAHKRLMLLSAIMLTDAGYGRWWGLWLFNHLGNGFWQFWMESYLGPGLLILLFAAYDLVTRKRLHPAFVWGAGWILGMQVIASALYVSPWWKPVATSLIQRFG